MARFLLACFILADALVVSLAIADAPSLSPSMDMAEAPTIRRLGKHHQPKVVSSSDEMPLNPSASQEPGIAKAPIFEVEPPAGEHSTGEQGFLNQPENQESELAEAPANQWLRKHHSSDKSMAGGAVILGGLATTFLVTIFCYIRATGKRLEK